MSGFVYAIASGDAVKIGWASDPLRRLSELQVGHATTIELIGYAPGSKDDERALHRKCASERIRGEWFSRGPVVSEVLSTVAFQSPISIPPAPPMKGGTFPIFEKVGGFECAIAIIISSVGRIPSKFVQDKWRAKKSLPARAKFALLLECQQRGIETTADDFQWRETEAAQ